MYTVEKNSDQSNILTFLANFGLDWCIIMEKFGMYSKKSNTRTRLMGLKFYKIEGEIIKHYWTTLLTLRTWHISCKGGIATLIKANSEK